MGKGNPKYLELVNWIKEQINLGNILPGDKLYSENELTQKFNLSRQTVRHAIGLLEEEGLLSRVKGSGTYINDDRVHNLEQRNRIAVITTYVDGYIFPRTIKGIEEILFEKGYSVQIAFTNNQLEREKMILEDILARDELAGIIMETTKSGLPNYNFKLYEELQRKKIPILFINSYYKELNIPHVSLNDYLTGKIATDHLLDKGHKKIGGIFKLDDGQGHQRYAGYIEALKQHNLEVDDSHIVWLDTFDVKHLDKVKYKLERLKECTGIVCYNDEVAFSLCEILKKQGYSIPRDVSLVSIDDSDLSTIGDVMLTSVTHPKEVLGKKAAENLLRMIQNIQFNGNYEFEPHITVRKSVLSLT